MEGTLVEVRPKLALGFAMPKDESGFALYQLHKSVGITILLLTLARLAWRVTNKPPRPVEGGFQGFLAKAVHTLLYVFMIGAPLTGSVRRLPVTANRAASAVACRTVKRV